MAELLARVAQLQAQCDQLQVERDREAARAREAIQRADDAGQRADAATKQTKAAEHRADRLALQIKRLAYLLYGRRSEKLNAEELGQLLLAFGGSDEDAQSEEPQVPAPPAPTEPVAAEGGSDSETPRKKRKHPGRTKLSPELERVVVEARVPDAERSCKCCGEPMACIGHREHENVEHVPEKLVVHVERRETLVCKNSACRGDAATAARINRPNVVRRAGVSLLAHLIERKCDDALPIHRQADQLLRLGFEVPVNTLYEYWAYATDVLGPIAKTTLSCVLGDSYVNVDDTKLKVLDPKHRKGSYLGHLWCFIGTRNLVAYTFTKNWDADEIAPYIGAVEGFIQCDDYKGYSKMVVVPGAGPRILVPPERRLGCMMHVRRRFHDAFKLGDKRATEPIAMIRKLYAIEAGAKALELDAAARLRLREQKSLPWLERFERWIDANEPQLLPKSKLGEACSYARQQRPFIRRCFSDGRFEIDNGRVERAIREPAIGRRNFHFTGSPQAARRLAHAYTLVQSCRMVGIPTREYLIDVLTKLEAGWPLRRVAELVPDRWAIEHRPLSPSKQSAE